MKRRIIPILIAALRGFGTIPAWTTKDAGCHVFMYFGERDAVEKQLIIHALDSEQEQGRNMLPEIAAWSCAKRLKVINLGLGRSGEADCIVVYGLMEMVSHFGLIGRTCGYRSDQDGCLINSGLATELFGGPDATGGYIWCRQKPYRMRGVIGDSSHVILLPAKDKDAMRYMMFTYARNGEGRTGEEGTSHGMETGKTAVVNSPYRNEIRFGKVSVDGAYVPAVAGLGACLPLWIISVWALSVLMRRRGTKAGAKTRVGMRAKAFILVAVFFLAGLLLIWELEPKIPPDLIPNRWSDFEFQSGKIEELRSDMAVVGEAGDVWWLAQMKSRLLPYSFCSFAGTVGGVLWGVKCIGHPGE